MGVQQNIQLTYMVVNLPTEMDDQRRTEIVPFLDVHSHFAGSNHMHTTSNRLTITHIKTTALIIDSP